MNKSAIVTYIQKPKNTRPEADVSDAERVQLGQIHNTWAIKYTTRGPHIQYKKRAL